MCSKTFMSNMVSVNSATVTLLQVSNIVMNE